jgi:Tfp pilus assembly protein PilF
MRHFRRVARAQELADQGYGRMQSGDYVGAGKKLVAAVELDDGAWVAWHHLGLSLLHLGEHENAAIAFENSTVLNPTDVRSWNNLGTTLGLLDRWEEAAVAFETGIEVDPKYPRSYLGRGNAFLVAGDERSARASFERALEVDPGYAKAREALSQFDS